MGRTIPNIRHLRAFSEVAARGGIRRASERMFLSQPAISQALARIEDRLGYELFERRRNRMLLTDTGEIFLERVNRISCGKAFAKRCASGPGARFGAG